jgi:RimJ/RimL family protein N-acetyltransferase
MDLSNKTIDIEGLAVNPQANETTATCHIAVSKPTKTLSELLDHAFVYAFKQLGLKRLTVFVESTNEKSLKITSHIGFVEEGVMHQAGDNGQDVIIKVLWPGNYRRGRKHG